MSILERISGGLRRISGGTAFPVMSITGLGMALSMLIDILIAVRLGTSALASALILALSLPRMIDIVAREGAKFSLLAIFVEQKRKRNQQSYSRFLNAVLHLFLVVGLVITLIGWIATPFLIDLLGPGLESEVKIAAGTLFRLGLPLTVFALGTVVLWVALNSHEYFIEASIRNVIASLSVILVMLLVWNQPSFPEWVAAGHTLGYALLFLLLGFSTFRKLGLKYDPRAWPNSDDIRQVFLGMRWPVMGFGVTQISRMIERSIASLVSPGGVAAYYFAFRLVSAIQSLIGVTIAMLGLPKITNLDLQGAREKLAKPLRRRIGHVIVLSAPLSIIILLFSDPIIDLLYGRGAFNAQSIQQTGSILLALGVGVVFRSLVPVLNSGLYAQRKFSWVFIAMLLTSLANVLLAWILSRFMGLVGIGLAVSVTGVISMFASMWLLRRSGVVLRLETASGERHG